MKREQFFIRGNDTLNAIMTNVYNAVKRRLDAGTVVVTLSDETRTIEQNSKLWTMLKDMSEQIVYCGKKRTSEAWKDILTVAWKDEVELVMSLDSTKVIAVGLSTSNMTKKEFSEFIEVIYVTGVDYSVNWSEKSIDIYNENKPK
jgi:hypothetical protein